MTQNQIPDIQKKLEETVSEAIAKLAQADRSDSDIANAYNAALDLHTLLSRPMRVAIGGEFSSGKSTFVKMLLGRHVVEMQASASAMPTVNFLYDTNLGYRAIGAKSSREISDISALTEAELRELECLEVMVDVPFLKQFEIFDTPGTADPTRDIDQILTVADQADFIIWCTNATQAWRESERRMWKSLPFELKKRSLLLVTHVDLPSIKPSIDRLMKRLNKEAAPLFRNVIPMELLLSVSARDAQGKITDQTAWDASGGAECLASMEAVTAEIRADVFESVKYDLENKILPVVVNLTTNTASFLSHWIHELHITKSKLQGADNTTIPLGYLKLLEKSIAFVEKDTNLQSKEPAKIKTRLEEVRDYIGNVLLQENVDENAHESHVVIEQLDWEFKHLNMLS